LNHAPSILHQLMDVIEERRQTLPENSYTTQLFAGGVPRISEKIIEEAQEVITAATEDGASGRDHLIHEAADLLFHLMVLLGHQEINIQEVEDELGRRFGVSGFEEKAARTND
jgi:phosphoribosyl-ATP pyrophosphohydrolase